MEERDFWHFMYGGSNRHRQSHHERFDDEFDVESESEERKHHKKESNRDVEGVNRSNKKESNRDVEGLNRSTCEKLADIIGGDVITSDPVCVVQRLRDIDATILGRRTQSPLALPFALSFENHSKKTLNLGETVILQKEINPFLTELRKRGIIVTAIHNHWLFDEPRLMYMHWENVGDPFDFARKSFEAAQEAGLF